mgnify:FL=1
MAKKTLKFNSAKAIEGFKTAILKATDQILEEYYNEIYSKMKTQKAKEGLTKMSETEENLIRIKIIGDANAIMDSYGTGSTMDKNNPYLQEYMNSELWNDLRQGYAIVGRAEGDYTNIYGNTAYSSGRMAGENVESVVHTRKPSYAFQNAEIWIEKGNRPKELLIDAIREYFSTIHFYFEYM